MFKFFFAVFDTDFVISVICFSRLLKLDVSCLTWGNPSKESTWYVSSSTILCKSLPVLLVLRFLFWIKTLLKPEPIKLELSVLNEIKTFAPSSATLEPAKLSWKKNFSDRFYSLPSMVRFTQRTNIRLQSGS